MKLVRFFICKLVFIFCICVFCVDGEKLVFFLWLLLDGILCVGGLCIEYGVILLISLSLFNMEIIDDKLMIDYEIMLFFDLLVERIFSFLEYVDVVEFVDLEYLESYMIIND